MYSHWHRLPFQVCDHIEQDIWDVPLDLVACPNAIFGLTVNKILMDWLIYAVAGLGLGAGTTAIFFRRPGGLADVESLENDTLRSCSGSRN